MNEQLTVITVNYHSQALIDNLEKMLSTLPEVKFMVVDNSGDYTSNQKTTRILAPGLNLGFGRACNLGAKHVETPLILFLNPDANIGTTAIRALMQQRPASMPRVIWGPSVLDAQQRAPVLERPGRLGLRYRRTYLREKVSPLDIRDVIYVSGACMMTTAEFFSELGGFCDDIFLYAEDLELCTRAAMLGASIQMLRHVSISHSGGRSSARFRDRLLRFVRSWQGHYRFLCRTDGRIGATINALHLASGVRF